MRRYVYRLDSPGVIEQVWKVIEPQDILAAAEDVSELENINPDSLRYELTPGGKIAHLIKKR